MIENIRAWLAEAALGAIEALGAPSAAPEFAPNPNGKGSTSLVREGYTPHTVPPRQTGRRAHVFEDIDSFAAWLRRHADPDDLEVLVAPSGAKAALTPFTPTGDIVSCPLALHPRWARWASLFDKQILQADLHRLVLSSPEDFLPVTDTTGAMLAPSYGPLLAAELAKFNLSKLKEVNIELDERGIVTFSAVSEKTTLQGRLPRSFVVRVPMLLGINVEDEDVEWAEADYSVEVLLQVKATEAGPPVFVLRCPQREVIERESRIDAVAWLRHLLGDGFLVGLGSLGLETVDQVEE